MGKLLQPHNQKKFKTFQSTKDKKKMTGLFKILSQNDNGGYFETMKASTEHIVAVNINYLEWGNIYIYNLCNTYNLINYTLEKTVI
jgi:hypothetical protein